MKKVLIFSPSNKGTIASCSANIIRALKAKDNVKVAIVVLYKEHNGIVEFENCRCVVDRTRDSNIDLNFWQRLKIFSLLKKEIMPDITISTLVSVSVLSVLSGGEDKKIGIFHAPLAQTKNVSYINYLLCAFSYRVLFRKLDYLYAVSETTKKDVGKYIGREAKVVYNIHDFVEIKRLSLFRLTSQEYEIFEKPTVLYVGHLYDTKGVRRLLSAFSEIGVDANLVFVGADQYGIVPQIYRNLSAELDIADRTFFLGYQSNPYKYMKNCSVLCLPSYSEGLPGVLIEALSLNRKIVTTNSSMGVWEIMQCQEDYVEALETPFENEFGIIVSNDDSGRLCVSQLKISIERILSEKPNDNLPFDRSRFEAKSLVDYFVLE